MSHLYSIDTEQVTVSVQPEYLEAESSPANGEYIWLYNIKIENNGKNVVQLLNREWHITDGHGLVQEIKGSGVIGVQPIIEPEQSFSYTSSVNLTTPSGMMYGHYQMKDNEGRLFMVNIPLFSLDSADQIRRPN